MTLFAKSLALAFAFAASAALAQTDPRANRPPEAATPDKPGTTLQSNQGCPMMNGHRMMNVSPMGARMRNGRMVDKDGKPIMGGMMGPHGMMCAPQASADAPSDKAAPKADR